MSSGGGEKARGGYDFENRRAGVDGVRDGGSGCGDGGGGGGVDGGRRKGVADGSKQQNLSYSYSNPFPTSTAIGTGYGLNHSLTPADVKSRGDGQNVLYGDKKLEFQNNPFSGMQKDNIFNKPRELAAAT